MNVLRWRTLFVDLLSKHAPVSTIRIKGNSAPYLTKEIKSMMYQRVTVEDVVC